MSEQIDVNFLNKVQKGLEPQFKPGETAIEYLKRTEAEKMAALNSRRTVVTPAGAGAGVEATKDSIELRRDAPKQQEVVFVDGHKFSRDFFTCIAVSLLRSGDPIVTETFAAFGLDLKDLDGKPVVFKKKRKK